MPDNVAISAGTGTTVAADEIVDGTLGTVKVQYVKLMDGTLDSTTKIGGANSLPVSLGSLTSTVNSSSTALLANGVFTGTSEDVSQYSSVNVFVFASHASATDGLSMQFSVDGTNWDNTDVYTIPATTGKTFSIQVVARFFRVVYTNGATAQSAFRMQTIHHYVMQLGSSIRPQDGRGNDNDMQEQLAHGMVYNGTTWDRARGDITNGQFVQVKAATNSAVTNMQTAAVAVGNGTNMNVQGYVSAIISITGTMGASTAVTFEASVDDTTFVSIAGHQIGLAGNLSPTTTNTGDFRFNVAAYKSIRARVSVFGTGSVTARGYASPIAGHPTTVNANIIAALPTGTNTIGNVLATDGTNIANNLSGTGTAAGQGSQLIAGAFQTINFTTGVTVGAQILGPYTVANYRSLTIQNTTIGAGLAVTPQFSADGGTTWTGTNTFQNPSNTANVTGGFIGGATSLYISTVIAPLFRLNVTALTTATYSGSIYLSVMPFTYHTFGVSAAQSGAYSVGSSSITGSAMPTTVFSMGVSDGTSLQAMRGMSVSTATGDTGAKIVTGNGATQTNIGNKGIQIFIVLGVVSGTTPTAVFKLQGSVDGTNFFDIPGATTASLTASTNVGITVFPGATVTAGVVTTGTTAIASTVIPRTWRVVWTIGGTTPSFAITSITYNYLPN